ncbi:ABC transporter permease [Actinoplanes sp. NPDC051851]|uniref:ABC transporter permease n=1 Tax=Actinoplanes sp. NPDC051851 TaxID=3154753 RepID=UPI003443D0C9
MRTLRTLLVGTLMHAKHMSRSSLEITLAMVLPLVQATLAVYLFRAADEPHRLLEAAVGAGLMGVWSSVLTGSGGAIQNQRWYGTLEMIMLAPRRPVMMILPITAATAVTGTYALLATLAWGRVVYGIPLEFAHPLAFLAAAVVCVLGLGMFGLLLASTFVLLRNANALANPLEYPVWMLSGMLVPLGVLPAWTGPVAALLPTTWGTRALREATGGGPVWPSIAVCLAISLVCLALGTVLLTSFERRARAAGTLALS